MRASPNPEVANDAVIPLVGASLRSMISRGDRFEKNGKVFRYESLVGPLWVFRAGDEILQIPSSSDGLPVLPSEHDVRRMLRTGEIRRVSNPLAVPARQRARAKEATKKEVLERDLVAQLRMDVCMWIDRTNPKRDDESLGAAFKIDFDETETLRLYGIYPSPSAVRDWAKTRGVPHDRRWCDMEATSGQGPRAARVRGFRYEMAVWHATRVFSKMGGRLKPASAWKALKRDVVRYNAGDPLKMDKFESIRLRPETRIDPMDRTTFYVLCARLESARNEGHRHGHAAVRSRREGGGASVEATRFMSVVQMDETPIDAFFFIDARRRRPLGTAVSTIAVCCATGLIVGWDISWEAASTASWLRTVLHMASLKEVPEIFKEEFPELELVAGTASAMVFDNATHYAGLAVQDAGGDLVQDVILAGEGEATQKGLVERTHRTLLEELVHKIPSRKFPIGIAREWNINLSGAVEIDLETYRRHFAKAVALHNVERKNGSDKRTRLEIAMEDIARHSIQLPKDLDQFSRAIGNVTYDRVIDKSGVVLFGLRFSSKRGTKNLIDDFIYASADRRRTKNPTFNAKIKIYTNLSRVGVFNPRLGDYEDLECTRRLYSAGLTLQMHRIILATQNERSFEDVPESVLLEVRGKVEDAVENDFPEALAKDQAAHLKILADPTTLAMMADRVEHVLVHASPTGMEVVRRDLGTDTRKDAMIVPSRGRRGGTDTDTLDDIAGASSGKATNDQSQPEQHAAPVQLSSAASTYGDMDDLL